MLAITNGRVLTVTGKTYDKATVLIEDGKIIQVGEQLELPEKVQTLDASNCFVTPGFIDAHTHIGTLIEPGTRNSFCDDNEEAADPATPHIRSIDSFNPEDLGVESARRAGFSVCCSLPGSGNVVGGQGFAFKTASKGTADEMMIAGTTVMKFALGENPVDAYGSRGLTPRTRMGTGGVLRQILFNAKLYSDQLSKVQGDLGASELERDFKLEALVPVVRKEMICRIHCHSSQDIATALRIAEEFDLKIVLEHATEGYKLADLIAQKKIPCVVGPLVGAPYKRELWGRRLTTPAKLAEVGVEIALTQDSGAETNMLPVYAGLCIKNGLTFEDAMRAMTINPARILGIDNRVGSIEAGKDADLAIFDGDPFSNYTTCCYTVINGEIFKNS